MFFKIDDAIQLCYIMSFIAYQAFFDGYSYR